MRLLLIEDDPDEVDRDQRRIARVVTDMIAEKEAGHARLATASEFVPELADYPVGAPTARDTIQNFAKLIIEMVELDNEGKDTEILQRATLNLARESFLSGELEPLMAFFKALKAPAEEGQRATPSSTGVPGGAPVYRQREDNGMWLFLACNGKWYVSDAGDMRAAGDASSPVRSQRSFRAAIRARLNAVRFCTRATAAGS